MAHVILLRGREGKNGNLFMLNAVGKVRKVFQTRRKVNFNKFELSNVITEMPQIKE